MRDCANVNMRDLLPDLLHDRLPAARRIEVQQHVAECDECRSELAVLRQVIAATPAPRVDLARVVAAVPAYQPTVPIWRSTLLKPQVRIAAAITLLVGGWALASSRTRNTVVVPSERIVQARDTSVAPAARAESAGTIRGETTPTPVPRPAQTELAVGDSFHDLSDGELRALLADLATFEAVTPAETEVVVPSLGRGGV